MQQSLKCCCITLLRRHHTSVLDVVTLGLKSRSFKPYGKLLFQKARRYSLVSLKPVTVQVPLPAPVALSELSFRQTVQDSRIASSNTTCVTLTKKNKP